MSLRRVDISPIQPDWVPPNCKFQIDDIEQPWTWPMSHFDYVHISHLEGSVAEWPALYAQAFAHIKSGGFVEVKEIDVELCSNHVVYAKKPGKVTKAEE
ncbi:UMTA [Colletotrichum lupini]|uniref:UMTA n=1 Tax=Colletotrichum lupini TaxID=145971 RepID=A0A9Q8SK32_9PEZI|nr:UMTA [Colletotrichum lupini]UQC78779.1 UMTA [Colletotrichum lupini]